MKYLSTRMKIGYGAGSFVESGFYNFPGTFLLLYLTTVVHLNPLIAGTICSTSLLMEGAGSVIAGYFSDQAYTKYGRRRPFVIVSGIAGSVLLCFLFIDVSSLGTGMVLYYSIVATLYWAAYSFFFIPYIALGGEMSDDYQERIDIRSFCRIYSILGNFFGTASPIFLVGVFMGRGLDQKTSWLMFSIIIAFVATSCTIISWRTTRGKEPLYDDQAMRPKRESLRRLFQDYWELLRLKCLSLLIFARTLFMIAYGFYTASLIYFMKFCMGFNNSVTSSVFLIGIIASIIYLSPINTISKKMGKHMAFLLSFLLAGVFGVLFTVFNVDKMVTMIVYICVFTYAQSSFWQINNAMFYDIAEVDEFKYGRKRQGSITSLMSVLGTFGVAIGIYLMGALLKVSGFVSEAAVQNAVSVKMIENIFILYPSILLLMASVIFLVYPLTEKRFEILKQALALKKQNKSYSHLEGEIRKLYWK